MEKDIGQYKIENLKGKNYVIHVPTQGKWDDVCKLIESKGISTTSINIKGWKECKEESCIRIYSKDCGYSGIKFYINNEHSVIVTYDQFIAANTPSMQQEYAIGDYVVVLDTPNVGKYNRDAIGKIQKFTDTRYTKKINEGDVGTLSDNEYGVNYTKEDIRPATTDEIKAIGIQVDEWKVGDKLPEKWLNNTEVHTYKGIYGPKRNKAHFINDKDIIEVRDGWGLISETADVWLNGKHNYPTYPGDVKVEEKYKIGDWVIVLLALGGHPVGSLCKIVKIDDDQFIIAINGNGTTYNNSKTGIRHARPDEIPQSSTSIPVTESNNKVYVRILKTGWINDDYAGQIGEVVEGNNVRNDAAFKVKMPNGNILVPYSPTALTPQCEWVTQPIPEVVQDGKWRIGDEFKYEGKGNSWKINRIEKDNTLGIDITPILYTQDDINGYIERGQWVCINRKNSTSKQVSINQQSNQNKQTKTVEHGKSNNKHTGESSRWDILLSDSEEPIVSRSGSRTGTAGYCRGEFPAVKCGYKGVGKGIERGQETTY